MDFNSILNGMLAENNSTCGKPGNCSGGGPAFGGGCGGLGIWVILLIIFCGCCNGGSWGGNNCNWGNWGNNCGCGGGCGCGDGCCIEKCRCRCRRKRRRRCCCDCDCNCNCNCGCGGNNSGCCGLGFIILIIAILCSCGNGCGGGCGCRPVCNDHKVLSVDNDCLGTND